MSRLAGHLIIIWELLCPPSTEKWLMPGNCGLSLSEGFRAEGTKTPAPHLDRQGEALAKIRKSFFAMGGADPFDAVFAFEFQTNNTATFTRFGRVIRRAYARRIPSTHSMSS